MAALRGVRLASVAGSRRTPCNLADYHRRWQQANRDKKRAQDRRYRERKRQDPDYWERRRARDRLYRARKRARLSDTPPEASKAETRARPALKDLDPSVFDRWRGVAGQGAPRRANPCGAPPGDMAKRHRAGMPTRRPLPPRRRVGFYLLLGQTIVRVLARLRYRGRGCTARHFGGSAGQSQSSGSAMPLAASSELRD
jgi:hypothetical protein